MSGYLRIIWWTMSICSSVAVTGSRPCSSAVDVDRPELTADPARSKARDVGHDGRLRLLDVQLVEVTLRFLAEHHRKIVVAVDEWRALVERASALEQHRIRRRALGHEWEKEKYKREWCSHRGIEDYCSLRTTATVKTFTGGAGGRRIRPGGAHKEFKAQKTPNPNRPTPQFAMYPCLRAPTLLSTPAPVRNPLS